MIFDENRPSRAFRLLALIPALIGLAGRSPAKAQPQLSAEGMNDFIAVPNATNAIQFRLFTSASPGAPHLFNTFEIRAHGDVLLASPCLNVPPGGTNATLAGSLHNLLVNGEGPELAATNGMRVVEKASGAGWTYLALDGAAGYRGRLSQFKRAILFVEPDLFVVYDHAVALEPSTFQFQIHPPASTRLDPIWGDLRLESEHATARIHAPAAQKKPRNWRRIDSAADQACPGTITTQLGPTNRLAQLDSLTVFAIHRAGEANELAFRLLEGGTAIGARIHRDGQPTLVAFKTNPPGEKASLIGFEFTGPVGVDVFRPKKRR